MNAADYRKHLARLALKQEEAGLLFGVSPRTGQRWTVDGPPDSVAALLLLAEEKGWSADELRKLIGRAQA